MVISISIDIMINILESIVLKVILHHFPRIIAKQIIVYARVCLCVSQYDCTPLTFFKLYVHILYNMYWWAYGLLY